jgi:hypothetical protein
VRVKPVGQVGLEPGDLSAQLGGYGHERSHRRAHGLTDQVRCGELVGAQGCLDLDGPGVDAALAAAPAQGGGDLRARQLPAQGRCRGHRQDGQGVAVGELGERVEGSGVVLAQRRAQLVDLALAVPDQRLMGPGQHLDRLGQIAVAGHGAVQVAVGAGQAGQHPGVTRIRLRARGREPLPIPRRGHRVHGQHRVPGRHQRPHEQTPIGLRGDHDIGRTLHVARDQFMEPGHALDPFGQPATRQPAALAVLDMNVMVGLSPVVTNKHCPHRQPPRRIGIEHGGGHQLPNGSVLEARHPTSHRTPSPTGKRTI